MSEALTALKTGNLAQSLQILQQEVRQRPDDSKKRVFLFQLLAVMGQWDRAVTQLDVISELDASAMPMVHAYKEAVRCERWREEAFAGRRAPVVFGEPAPWTAQLIDALRLDAAGDLAGAAAARAAAFEAAPSVNGTIDDVPFEWLADADPRLGPVLEMVSNGSYYWIPMGHIRRLRLEAPSDLRDHVWMPAGLTLVNGGELVGFIPTRYAGTVAAAGGPDGDALLLSRRTDWEAHGADAQIGLGQRLLATNETDYALMDVREILFDHPVQESPADDEEDDPANDA